MLINSVRNRVVLIAETEVRYQDLSHLILLDEGTYNPTNSLGLYGSVSEQYPIQRNKR